MTHTFLLKPGQWRLKGFWCETHLNPVPIEGTVNIVWNQPNWFSYTQRLTLPHHQENSINNYYFSSSELFLNYRGYLGFQQSQYTFVLKHNQLGNLEGNGWITPTSIIQRYWVLNDRKRRQGFETFYQKQADTYYFCSCLTQGHQMIITLEAILTCASKGELNPG